MHIEKEKIRTDKLYRIGYIACLDKYVLASVVGWAVWYDRFYEISEEEYLLYDTDMPRLDDLAKELRDHGERSERLLFSEKNEENTSEQAELRQKCIQYARSITKSAE